MCVANGSMQAACFLCKMGVVCDLGEALPEKVCFSSEGKDVKEREILQGYGGRRGGRNRDADGTGHW